jgi:hypothetical protein
LRFNGWLFVGCLANALSRSPSTRVKNPHRELTYCESGSVAFIMLWVRHVPPAHKFVNSMAGEFVTKRVDSVLVAGGLALALLAQVLTVRSHPCIDGVFILLFPLIFLGSSSLITLSFEKKYSKRVAACLCLFFLLVSVPRSSTLANQFTRLFSLSYRADRRTA